MSDKYYIPEGESAPVSQIGACLDALAATIAARRAAGARDCAPESYTYALLTEPVDALLKKVMEEAGEVALAAKDVEACRAATDARIDAAPASASALDAALDHLRYEAGDVVYHLFVLLGRYGISADELAAELNTRMQPDERPCGGALMNQEHVRRG